eukprot:EG_transcript_20579
MGPGHPSCLALVFLFILLITVGAHDLDDLDDEDELSLHDLRMILQKRGVDHRGLTQRPQLLAKVRETSAAPRPKATLGAADGEDDDFEGDEDVADAPDGDGAPAAAVGGKRRPRLLDPGDLQIRFCMGRGYKEAYTDYAQRLGKAFPGMRITGDAYPPSQIMSLLSTACQFLFFGGILSNLLGSLVLPPAVAQWLKDHRLLSLAVPMAANVAAAQLVVTGAFEVTYNGLPIFSKLQEGRMIGFKELQGLIEQAQGITPDLPDALRSPHLSLS